MTGQRRDLGEMFVRLGRLLVAAEQPVLDELGVPMWDYVVLGALRAGPAPSQAALAGVTGRDATRLIPILDRLERGGLVRRTPDPADRRRSVIALTPDGERVHDRCRGAIRAMEARLLAGLPELERSAFVAQLERVAELLLDPT